MYELQKQAYDNGIECGLDTSSDESSYVRVCIKLPCTETGLNYIPLLDFHRIQFP